MSKRHVKFRYLAGLLCLALMNGCGDNIKQLFPPNCGDGILNILDGEKCDDGNNLSGDGCSEDCKSDERCGNGIEDMDEECDDYGNSAVCDFDCTTPLCGDGLLNERAGEQCDGDEPMGTTICRSDCTIPVCGDGVHDPDAGEICDTGGNSSTCDEDCTTPSCGDGLHNEQADEECDTGGANTDSCDADCTLPECGDGVHNPAVGEMCDTGGDSPTCDFDCTLALCPDGYHNPQAGEQCDDGNGDNTDGCDTACQCTGEICPPDP